MTSMTSSRRAALAAAGLAGLITIVSLLLGARLLVVGASASPPSAALVCLAGGLLILLTAALHRAVQPLPAALGVRRRGWIVTIQAAPTAALALNLGAIGRLPNAAATIPLWLAGLALTWLIWRRWPPAVTNSDMPAPPPAAGVEVGEPETPTEADSGPVQRVERTVEGGLEVLRLWQRIELAPWERRTTVHWPFWPALPAAPEVSAEAVAESAAEVRVEQSLPYGCRLRIEVEEVDERPQLVELEAVAISPAAVTGTAPDPVP